ncbi:hypothetical protein, partial [Pseudomonas marginalis]|uniref:hypothetical protein n=1 Tax=Pseudomonas marginalis TaxID=298 RepID=UPI0034D399D0
DSHLYKQDSDIFPSDPILNSFLRKMRILTSLATMPYNGLAQSINIFMGNYNNWRSENNETMKQGYSRLFGGKHKITKDSG